MLCGLLRVQGFSKALEILRLDKNKPMARTFDIRNEKKRDGKKNRQN
jgi:hypothetical protein